MKRSAIVQKALMFPLVTWTRPTASIATQLRIVAGSAREQGGEISGRLSEVEIYLRLDSWRLMMLSDRNEQRLG